jgi:hypothetical protein
MEGESLESHGKHLHYPDVPFPLGLPLSTLHPKVMFELVRLTEVPDESPKHLGEGEEECSDSNMTPRIGEVPDPHKTDENIVHHGAVVPLLVPISQIRSETFMARSK